MNNVTPLHRGIVRPATNDQGMVDAEALDWSLLFFVGLCGFVGGFVVACLSLIIGAYFAGALA
jgi:hypothetical protein